MKEIVPLERSQPPEPPPEIIPLVVDLDGTLVKTDLLVESFFALIKHNPLYIFVFPFWLLKGKAFLKQQVVQRVTFDVGVLPYNQELLDLLKLQRSHGRPLVLATANDERIANQVADHLQIFDRVLASNGKLNFSRRHKRERLVQVFGDKGFDYAGNGRYDLEVWSAARKALIVNCPKSVARRAARVVEVERVFDDRGGMIMAYLRAWRPQQWLKNLLVFVPLVMAHRYNEPDLLLRAFLAFVAFGLCASSVYIINDLVDLPSDRHHPRKRQRPLAAGDLSLLSGLASAPLLFGLSLLVSLILPRPFLGMLLMYFFLNLGYSFTLKRIELLDVIILAGLYSMRIIAGAASVGIWPSSWLLAFSTFLFFSLALVKRYAELVAMRQEGGESARVRGYRVIDMELLASLGGGSGYVAVLVLAIYISSGVAERLYTRGTVLWFLCPLLLYWISYVWLIAHRGQMHDDPLVFTVRNRASQAVMIVAATILLLAR